MTKLDTDLKPARAAPKRGGISFKHLQLRPKDIAFQVIVVAVIAVVLAYIVNNVIVNTRALNIETGFAFLDRPAGFAISQTLISYTNTSTYLDAFKAAFLNTVFLTAVCIVLATFMGLFIALARISTNPMVARAALVFIETVRNVPLLLHLLIWYYVVVRALPSPRDSISILDVAYLNSRGFFFASPTGDFRVGFVLAFVAAGIVAAWGLRRLARHPDRSASARSTLQRLAIVALVAFPAVALLSGQSGLAWSIPELSGFNFRGGSAVVPEFVAMVLGISVYSSAFVAEIFRGGLNSVSGGMREAGLALGLGSSFVNMRVVVPLALRAAIPPLGGQYVIMLKNTSLAAVIAYPDLMQVMAGTALNQTGQPLEVMFITLGAYVVLGLLISVVINIWNRRLALVTR